MKQTLLLIAIVCISTVITHAQDNRALRAARMSFNEAETNYNRGNYQEAAREFAIVVNTIPAGIDSRRQLQRRLESLIYLVDIHFYKHVNIDQACEYLNMYYRQMNLIRNEGILRSSRLLRYQQKEQEFRESHTPKCKGYQKIEQDRDEFRRSFEKEFE